MESPETEPVVEAPAVNRPTHPHAEAPIVQEAAALQEGPEEEEAEDELTARMRQLLEAAAAREAAVEGEKVNKDRDANSSITTRSRGVQLSWNPDMNSSKPLIELSDNEL